MDSIKDKHIVSLIGYQGSGKTTIGSHLSKSLSTLHLETSDIVRAVSGIQKREQLAGTASLTKIDPDWLGKAVAESIGITTHKVVVLTGVRERTVHEYLASYCEKLYVIELEADPALRFVRLQELGKVKNAEQFIEQEIREKNLGMDIVSKDAEYKIPTSQNTNPIHIAKAIKELLSNKGVIVCS